MKLLALLLAVAAAAWFVTTQSDETRGHVATAKVQPGAVVKMTEQQAQAKSAAIYPELAQAGSWFNRRFVSKARGISPAQRMADSEWPLTLAATVASEREEMAAERANESRRVWSQLPDGQWVQHDRSVSGMRSVGL